MAVKEFIDLARAAPGYAGLAIFSGDREIFSDRIEPDYAIRLRMLCCRVLGSNGSGNEYLCAVASGFTFYVCYDTGLLIILRLSGRFSPRPSLSVAESDFADPPGETALPSREGLRREAEALLRQYELL